MGVSFGCCTKGPCVGLKEQKRVFSQSWRPKVCELELVRPHGPHGTDGWTSSHGPGSCAACPVLVLSAQRAPELVVWCSWWKAASPREQGALPAVSEVGDVPLEPAAAGPGNQCLWLSPLHSFQKPLFVGLKTSAVLSCTLFWRAGTLTSLPTEIPQHPLICWELGGCSGVPFATDPCISPFQHVFESPSCPLHLR